MIKWITAPGYIRSWFCTVAVCLWWPKSCSLYLTVSNQQCQCVVTEYGRRSDNCQQSLISPRQFTIRLSLTIIGVIDNLVILILHRLALSDTSHQERLKEGRAAISKLVEPIDVWDRRTEQDIKESIWCILVSEYNEIRKDDVFAIYLVKECLSPM